MLKTKSIATVGNRNRYGANREPHRDGLGGVTNDLASAGDVVFGALIRNYFDPPSVGRARLPNGLKKSNPFANDSTAIWSLALP
jgi:hypothetical protein